MVQFQSFLNPKFSASNHLLCMYRPVCVGPGQNPNCWFSHAQTVFVSPQSFESTKEKKEVGFANLLAGYVSDDKISIVACVACPSLSPEDVEHTTETVRNVLPAGKRNICPHKFLIEPRREKTGLRDFRPGPTQTGLYKLRKELEA